MAPVIDRINARLANTEAELAVLDREGHVASVVPLGRGLTLSAGGVLRVAGKLVSAPEGAGGAVVREVGTGRLLFAL